MQSILMVENLSREYHLHVALFFFTIIESILMVENLSRGYHLHVVDTDGGEFVPRISSTCSSFFQEQISRAGTADPSGAPEFMPGSCCSILSAL
jgi:hypothetical protein